MSECPITPTPKRRKRTWIQRLLFGDVDPKYDCLIDALDTNTQETREMRSTLREIAQKADPLLQLIRNMHDARKLERESGIQRNA